ncbi:ANTAR domain-containing protein [Streptomyces avermitilis]|uniref:ANTAR domain-containing protein n=1 Tax=Streptomyces avermitilis TaxID=33903 RepID=UPI0033B571AC
MSEYELSPLSGGVEDAALSGGVEDAAPCPWLKVEAQPAGDRQVVVAYGDIDVDTESILQRALREALDRSVSGVNLDLGAVGFCDCAGLNVLLRMRRHALAHGKTLAVQDAGPATGRLLMMTGTRSLFDVAAGPGMRAAGQNPRATEPHDPSRSDPVDGTDRGRDRTDLDIDRTIDGTDRGRDPTVLDIDRTIDGTVVDLRLEVGQLRRAMQTRPVIDLARGVLMASFGLSAEDAWTVLVTVSQHTNTKLHQIAEELVDTVQGAPLPEPLQRQLAEAVMPFSRAREPGA